MHNYHDRKIMNKCFSENNMNNVPPTVYQTLQNGKVNLKVLISTKML